MIVFAKELINKEDLYDALENTLHDFKESGLPVSSEMLRYGEILVETFATGQAKYQLKRKLKKDILEDRYEYLLNGILSDYNFTPNLKKIPNLNIDTNYSYMNLKLSQELSKKEKGLNWVIASLLLVLLEKGLNIYRSLYL